MQTPSPAMSTGLQQIARPARRLRSIQFPRSFSTTSPRHAAAAQAQEQKRIGVRPNPRSSQKRSENSPEVQRMRKKMAHDIGVMEGTFVKPYNRPTLPSWLNFNERLAIEWQQIKSRVAGIITLCVFKFRTRKMPARSIGWRDCMPLWPRKELYDEAISLRLQLNDALTAGNLKEIGKLTTNRFSETFQHIVEARPPGTKIESSIEIIGSPRILQDRAGLTADEATGLRQVLMRLKTRQSLLRTDASGTVINKIDGRNVAEFMVMQNILRHGRSQGWRIQSFQKEQSVQAFKKAEDDQAMRQSAVQAHNEKHLAAT